MRSIRAIYLPCHSIVRDLNSDRSTLRDESATVGRAPAGQQLAATITRLYETRRTASDGLAPTVRQLAATITRLYQPFDLAMYSGWARGDPAMMNMRTRSRYESPSDTFDRVSVVSVPLCFKP